MEEIYREKFEEPVDSTIIEYGEDILVIGSDKRINLKTSHSQSCCENVYMDAGDINKGEIERLEDIKEISLSLDKQIGLVLFLYPVDDTKMERLGVLLPCRDIQNGYYSNNLELNINGTVIDITEATDHSESY